VVSVVSQWARTEPDAAAAWVTGFGEGKLRENAARDLISNWAQDDSTAAGQWLQTLPAGASRESAVQAYVGQLAYPSPELAAPWAETLTDQNTRFNQMENIARQWLNTDRSAAEVWLAKVNLPDDRKQRLLKRP
jgi:hypothetical protein